MSADAFFTRLDALLGERTIKGLESEAHLGNATLSNARKRGNVPSLAVVLALCRTLGCQPVDLLGDGTPAELATPALQRIPFLQLTASHLNPRRGIGLDTTSLAELADSIAEQGLLQNLVVRRDADQAAICWIVAGERRFRAIEQLMRENRLPPDLADGIPCRVVDATDDEHVVLALLENMQRVDVHPLDEAEALARLHAIDPLRWSTRHIATRLGVTQRQVQLRIQLATKLGAEGKRLLREGSLTLGEAKLLAMQSEERQDEMLEQREDNGGGYSAEKDMADDLSRSMFPVVMAAFDVQASGLETWTHPDGEEFFVDMPAAIAAQAKAAQQRIAEYQASGAAFVDVVQWLNPSVHAEGGEGVVIVYPTAVWHFEIHKSMRRLSPVAARHRDDEDYSDITHATAGRGDPVPLALPDAIDTAERLYRQAHITACQQLMKAVHHIMPPLEGFGMPAPLIHIAQAIGFKPADILYDDAAARERRIAQWQAEAAARAKAA